MDNLPLEKRLRIGIQTIHRRTEPAVGVSSPARMFISVDLPLPDAPTSAASSPDPTSRSRPCRAWTSMPPGATKMRTSRSQTISESAP